MAGYEQFILRFSNCTLYIFTKCFQVQNVSGARERTSEQWPRWARWTPNLAPDPGRRHTLGAAQTTCRAAIK